MLLTATFFRTTVIFRSVVQKSIANPRKVSLRHTAIHSTTVRTLQFEPTRRMSSQCPRHWDPGILIGH
ncbi:hypothetical protein [Wolbachia endosymbiont (group A) of Andrena trimmerana]|uniref:hypothetical protein n=1 Tax=Wolbachia endosymbiont (group A) of Andrena trimmerana TaxID=3066193 RepID=UPI003340D55C